MSANLWLQLLVTVAIGCATVYVRSALHTEEGRRRVSPFLRPVMRVMNPNVVRAVETSRCFECSLDRSVSARQGPF